MIKQVDDGILVRIRILPGASRNEIVFDEDFVKIKIAAQPVENKANKALIEFLSKHFRLPKSSIKIIKGENTKEKTLLFSTDDSEKKNFIISQLTK